MIIGIIGKKGAGKSTAADIFTRKYGFTELAFGNPVKVAAAHLVGVDPDWLVSCKSEEKEVIVPGYSFTYRDLLQKLGTDFARDMMDSEFWIKRMDRSFHKHLGSNIVISDIRFDNEAEFVLKNGGVLITIERNTKSSDTHQSEAGVSDQFVGYIIYNNSDIKTLKLEIESFIYNQGITF